VDGNDTCRVPTKWPLRTPFATVAASPGLRLFPYIRLMDAFQRFGSLMTGATPVLDDDAWNDLFSELRASGPVGRADDLDAWVMTTYEACSEALLSADLSPDQSFWRHYEAPEPDPVLDPMRETNLFAAGPDDHHRLRSLALRAFTPSKVRGYESIIAEVVADTLDRVDLAGFDAATEVADVIPSAVIRSLLDVPEQLMPPFCAYAEAIIGEIGPGFDTELPEHLSALRAGIGALEELITDRRENRGHDLLSALICAEEDNHQLSDTQLLGLTGAIVVGGTETTRSTIGLGLLRLLQHPEQLEVLRDRPELWPSAVAEIARFDWVGPALPRYVSSPTTVAGKTLAVGDLVLLCIPGANRDPAVFAEPDRFDIERTVERTLAFGFGAHYCLGAHLAALEISTALRMLVELPDLTLTGVARFRADAGPRRLATLPVRATGS